MTQGDRVALEALNSRFGHTAVIALLVAEHADVGAEIEMALRGIAATLDELCERLDAVANSVEENLS